MHTEFTSSTVLFIGITKQTIPSRTHETPDLSPMPVCNLPRHPALPCQLNSPSPGFHRIRPSQTVSSFNIYRAQDCQFLPKGKGQNKVILFLPLFYNIPFLLQVQKFLMYTPIQCIRFSLSPIPILFFPVSHILLGSFPEYTKLP